MIPLNPFIVKNTPRIINFIDELSVSCRGQRCCARIIFQRDWCRLHSNTVQSKQSEDQVPGCLTLLFC